MLHKLDHLGYFYLCLLALELGLLIIMQTNRNAYKVRRIHIFLLILILSIAVGLIFKIDWNLEGENKDGIITGKVFGLLLAIINVINFLIVLFSFGLEKLLVKTPIKH
jgi:hypothetical protein